MGSEYFLRDHRRKKRRSALAPPGSDSREPLVRIQCFRGTVRLRAGGSVMVRQWRESRAFLCGSTPHVLVAALIGLVLGSGVANAATGRSLRLEGKVQTAGAGLEGYKVSLYTSLLDRGPSWKQLGSSTTNSAGDFQITYALPPWLAE